ncbi:TPA: hypothetical protein OL425_002962 [Clostridioides difficile]|nr:hypothetical protein [Clostridioides difficile]HCQ6057406.1 hypothetical protein [Clostridioides difficile]
MEYKENIKVFIIMFFLIMSFFSFIYKGSAVPNFIDLFSFGATITSIILSVIAIMYTFIDSYQSQEINNRIASSSEEIKTTVFKLRNISNKIENLSDNFNDLKQHVEINNNQLKEFKDNLVNKESLFTEDSFSLSNINLGNLIEGFTMQTKRNCLLIAQSYEHNIEIDISDFNLFYNQSLRSRDLPLSDIVGEFVAILDLLSSFGLIKCNIISNAVNIKIENINIYFLKEINEHLPKVGDFSDDLEDRELGSVFRYIDNYIYK